MMTLRLMQAVVATVNEQGESPVVDQILQRWEHDGPAKFWRASANFVFFFKNGGRDFVLRFNHADERSVDGTGAEVAFVNGLADKGIPVAKPIRSLSGEYVESVDTALGTFHAVAFEALHGEQFEAEDLSSGQLTHWGRAFEALHNASAHLSASGSAPDRPTWHNHLAMVTEILPPDEMSALRMVDTLREQLGQLPVTAENFGLIHYDFEQDNLIWSGESSGATAGIVDLDDSACYWYVADIALALGDVLGDRASAVDLQNPSFLHFIEGYRSARPLPDEELARIPLFMRLGNLVAFARLHRALTPVNPRGELPWMAGLRHKLAAKMQVYRDEFSQLDP